MPELIDATSVRDDRRGPPRLAWLAWVAVLGVASGCSFGGGASSVPAIVNSCVSSIDCGNATCVENACVASTTAPLSLAITISSDPADSAAERFAYTVDDITLTGPTVRDLAVPDLADVYGVVAFGVVPVKADVTAYRFGPYGAAPLALDVVSTRASPMPSAGPDGDPYHYALRVVASEQYFLYAAPTGVVADAYPGFSEAVAGEPLANLFPPMLVPAFRASDAGSGPVRADFTYPSSLFTACTDVKKDGCSLVGRVVFVDAGGTTSAPPSADAYHVRAKLRDRDLPVSNLATTDADGTFLVRITPGAPAYDLVLEGAAGSGLPSTRIPVEAITLTGGELVVSLPLITPARYVGTVETFDGQPLAGVSVELTSMSLEAPATPALFQHETATTADGTHGTIPGTFDVALVPGTFAVTFRATSPDEAASLSTMIIARATPDGRPILGPLFRLPMSSHLGGVIHTFLGERAPYLAISAVPLGTYSFAGDLTRIPTTSAATADTTGLFSLPVDRATFDLVVSPPSMSRFGAVVVTGLDLSNGGDRSDLDIVLPPPVTLDGRVTIGTSSVPLPDHVLRAYLVLDDAGGRRLAPIGDARTDADGRYRFYLSPR